MYTKGERIEPRYIEEEIKDSYITYAMSVIVGRALPDARDGLKPVHRRILYTMNDLGLQHNKPHKKCARIVGECFVKNTLVLTDRGLVPILDVQQGDMVYTQRGINRISGLYEMPPQKLLKITLDNGTNNIVTPSQKFKVINRDFDFEWKEAKDLTNNDYIVIKAFYPEIKRKVKLKKCDKLNPAYLDEDLAYLLGFFMADGWISKNKDKKDTYRIGFLCNSDEVIKKIADILMKEFDYVPDIRERAYLMRGKHKTYVSYNYTVRTCRKYIVDFFRENFNLAGLKAPTKTVPQQIFNSPKSVIFSFVSGLIDGDGSIHKKRNAIHYGSTSEELIDRLLILLQHCGIFGAKYTDKRAKTRKDLVNGCWILARHKFYYLEFKGINARLLASKLKLFNTQKQAALNEIRNRILKKSRYETIPYAGENIFSELSKAHLGSGWYKSSDGSKFRQGIKYPAGCKIRYAQDLKEKPLRKSQIIEWGIKEKLQRIDSPLYNFLNHIIEDDIYFLKVSSIEETEAEKTYDLQVENKHEFVANGMLSHNCLGKYHPHGDMAVYDALVRMVQDFSLRYPLVGGQGNFGCFTKDTRVRLTNGRKLSFGELAQEEKEGRINYTYTYNIKKHQIEIAKIEFPHLTKRNTELVEVGLDNGKKIKCTPNHRFMLRDGTYKEAKDLKTNDSLMPLYVRLSTQADNLYIAGYKMVYQPFTDEWEHAHRPTGEWNIPQEACQKSTTATRLNHRVVAVKKLRQKEDVYDLTIKDTHNFALAAGVFVHNSVDGDPAAALRYTEARMAATAEEMIKDIDKDTVDFVPNFDDTLLEPLVLPSALPNLLINGSSGIAVGMATNMPPHNLREIADGIVKVIDSPNTSTEDLMKIVKAPDFPTGALICGKDGIKRAYLTGRGTLKLHARANIETQKSGREAIVVTELPYQTNKANLVASIASLAEQRKIEGIADIRDESDRDGMRIVIDIKRDQPSQVILNQLYKHTQLATTFGIIMLALVRNQPRVLNLRQLIDVYIEHRREVVTRRTKFELAKAQTRAHILEGLKIALKHIDKIVKTIKTSKSTDDARRALVKNFDLTEKQAQAILEMQLQRLTALERSKIDAEYLELIKKIEYYQSVLKSEKKILAIIKEELVTIKNKYGDERRTEIVAAEEELEIEDLIAEEDMVITISHAGYIKRLPISSYRRHHRGGKGITGAGLREEDFIEHLFIASTHEYILFFTDKGKAYWLKVHEIPQAGRVSKGKAIVNLVQLSKDENITAFVPVRKFGENFYLIMATKKGYVKRVNLSAFSNPRKAGIIAITLDKDDILTHVVMTDGKQEIVLASELGKSLRFKEAGVREMGRAARGVRGISLRGKDSVIGMEAVRKDATLLTVTKKGFGKRSELSQYRTQRRGGKGIINIKISSKNGPVVGIKTVKDDGEVMVITQHGMIVRMPVKDIRTTGRSTQGVRLISLEDKDTVSAVASVVAEEK